MRLAAGIVYARDMGNRDERERVGDVNPLRWPRRMLDRLCAGRADYAAFRQRQRSAAYRARKNRCRWLWILSGVIMLIHPQPSFVIVLFLGTTFLCLALLDEA